jgi:hypothetical protein
MTAYGIWISIEPHRKGTKMAVHCPEHGRVGVRFLTDEIKQLAVDHELEHIKADNEK